MAIDAFADVADMLGRWELNRNQAGPLGSTYFRQGPASRGWLHARLQRALRPTWQRWCARSITGVTRTPWARRRPFSPSGALLLGDARGDGAGSLLAPGAVVAVDEGWARCLRERHAAFPSQVRAASRWPLVASRRSTARGVAPGSSLLTDPGAAHAGCRSWTRGSPPEAFWTKRLLASAPTPMPGAVLEGCG
ncbi:MAG: hypothetical protein IPG17_20055 [Sandaracinaceae bacterium]|nr:hypothetical protein [Sandaracinaceae bacterium]